jgi:hypothetical protein
MEFCAKRKTPEAIAATRQLLTFGGVNDAGISMVEMPVISIVEMPVAGQ